MKKLFFAFAAMMVSTLCFAQGFGGGMGFGGGQGQQMSPEDRAKRQADQLKEQLTLNQAQYDSIYTYYVKNAKEQQKQREEMMNGGGQGQMDMQAMMEQMQKQREAQEAKIKSFLTDDQKKAYDKAQQERRERMQQGGMGGFGGGFGGPQGGQAF